MKKDLRIFLRFKNAILLDAIYERFGDGVSMIKVAKEIGVHYQQLLSLITLRFNPYSAANRSGSEKVNGIRYSPSAMKIANYLYYDPQELYPADLYNLTLPKVISKDFASIQFLSLQEAREQRLIPHYDRSDQLEKAHDLSIMLDILPDREARILRWRFGIDGEELTLDEIAEKEKCGKGRIRQLEAKAIRRIRKIKIKGL